MNRTVILALLVLVPNRPSPAQEEDATQARLKDSHRRLLAKFRQNLESPDARPWDVAARAEAIGSDPKALLEFVRTQIRFEPYPGMQRGASGVLVSGGGNSADKSFLLAELLRARGHKARIVRGLLKREQAEELATAALAAAKTGPLETLQGPFGRAELDDKKVTALCGDVGLSTEEMLTQRKRAARDRNDRWNEVLDIAEREFKYIQEKFSDAASVKGREIHEEIVEWLRPHYWVQVQPAGKDEWSDLDSSFRNLEAGRRATDAVGESIDPAAVADRFSIKLFMDRTVDGKPETQTLLEYDFPVYEALVRPVRFTILPDREFEKVTQPEKPLNDAELRERLQSFRRFQAELAVGSETVGSRPFDLDGKIFKISANGTFAGATLAEKIEGAMDLFDDSPKPTLEMKEMSARLAVTREGKELWSRDRTLLEKDKKETWCPILNWNLFFQPHAFSRSFERGLQMRQAMINQGFSERAIGLDPASDGRKLAESLGAPAFQYPYSLLSMARSRQTFALSRASGRPLQLLWEHPDLFISGNQVRLKGSGGLCLCDGFDLVENGALVLEAGERFVLRRDDTSALGTFDTVLEQVLLRQANPSEGTTGTLAPFERARLLGGKTQVLKPTDADLLRGAGLSNSDAAWIGKHSGAAERVLVAEGQGSAWWSLDPLSGRVVGRISGGRGGCEACSTTAEYSILSQNNVAVAVCLGRLISRVTSGQRADTLQLDSLVLCFGGAWLGVAGVEGGVGIGVALVSGMIDIASERD